MTELGDLESGKAKRRPMKPEVRPKPYFEIGPAKRRDEGKIKKTVIALATTAVLAGGAGLKIADSHNEPHGTPYQTFATHEVSAINSWEEDIRNQITSGGKLEIADLKIKVESGILYGRYTPVVQNIDDTDPGNVAIEFNPGAEYIIDDAIIIHGETADPNDPNGDRWAWIDGKSIGLSHDIYINLSKQTLEKIQITQSRSVDFSRINTNGDVYYRGSNGQEVLAPQIIQEPQPVQPSGPTT